jgi:hypothetical protein
VSEARNFLSRWSRRKRDAGKPAEKPAAEPVEKLAASPAAAHPPAQAPALPPVESLTFDSDFSVYLKANVEESVKRAALKKLLHDPRFNVMDGLDTYIDDYTKNDPIPDEMLRKLEHVRSTFQGLEQPKEEANTQTARSDAQIEKHDEQARGGDPRQDT